MLTVCALVVIGCSLSYAAPFSGKYQDVMSHPMAFTDSLGQTVIANPSYTRNQFVGDMNAAAEDAPLVRRRRLADDKKLDLKMKMQRVKKVVSLDAIGSYSLYRSDDRKTSLKAFGSTELWYDGTGFGLKKPGLGVQFTIYY